MQCDKVLELQKAFEAMIALLEKEHQIIRSRETSDLAAITQEKETLARKLEILGQTLIRELKLTTNPQQEEKLLSLIASHCKQHPNLAKILKDSSIKVQELNNRNGILLQSVIRVNEQSLNILTGRSSQAMTYQSSGLLRPEQSTSQIPLASV